MYVVVRVKNTVFSLTNLIIDFLLFIIITSLNTIIINVGEGRSICGIKARLDYAVVRNYSSRRSSLRLPHTLAGHFFEPGSPTRERL